MLPPLPQFFLSAVLLRRRRCLLQGSKQRVIHGELDGYLGHVAHECDTKAHIYPAQPLSTQHLPAAHSNVAGQQVRLHARVSMMVGGWASKHTACTAAAGGIVQWCTPGACMHSSCVYVQTQMVGASTHGGCKHTYCGAQPSEDWHAVAGHRERVHAQNI